MSTDYYYHLTAETAAQVPGVRRLEHTQDCGSYRWGRMPLKAMDSSWLLAKYKCRNRARWQIAYAGGRQRVVCWPHLPGALQSRELAERIMQPGRENEPGGLDRQVPGRPGSRTRAEHLAWLLHEIYDTSSVPYKATGKFAYIASLAADGLETLGEEPGQPQREQETGS